MRSAFRDLTAYSAPAALGDELYLAVAQWNAFARWGMGLQLTRAIDSVAANVSEGSGREGADRRRFYVIARGSLRETEHWLARAHARGVMSEDLTPRLDEIAWTLDGLIRRPRGS